MRQFDVCRLRTAGGGLVVVLQHDVADELDTRVVAPLSDQPFRKLMAHLRIPVQVDGRRYVIQLDRLAAVTRGELGSVMLNLSDEGDRIKRGLDLLFLGV